MTGAMGAIEEFGLSLAERGFSGPIRVIVPRPLWRALVDEFDQKLSFARVGVMTGIVTRATINTAAGPIVVEVAQ